MKNLQYSFQPFSRINKLLLTGAMLLAFSAGWSQTGTVLDTARSWTSYENIDLYSDLHVPDTFSIQLSATALKLGNRSIEREFPVSNVAGNWTDFSQAGEITFNVQVLTLAGKGKLKREGGTLSLVIDLSERPAWMYRKYIINQP